jgi:hypothetical protein
MKAMLSRVGLNELLGCAFHKLENLSQAQLQHQIYEFTFNTPKSHELALVLWDSK